MKKITLILVLIATLISCDDNDKYNESDFQGFWLETGKLTSDFVTHSIELSNNGDGYYKEVRTHINADNETIKEILVEKTISNYIVFTVKDTHLLDLKLEDGQEKRFQIYEKSNKNMKLIKNDIVHYFIKQN